MRKHGRRKRKRRSLQVECVSVLHEALLVPALLQGGETMVWKKVRSRNIALQVDNLRVLREWIECRMHISGRCVE